MSKLIGVKFLLEDMRSAHGNENPWIVGETRSIKGDLKLCRRGYHYCPTWAAALRGGWLYGPIAAIVEVDDDGPKDDTKGCSRTMTVLETFDVSRAMRLYAADEAERCLKAWEKRTGKKAHRDSWAAIAAARAFANGKITTDELTAARSAAYSAAYSADSAAYSAARSAAYSAARSAAYSAAYSAARSAAYSAANSAYSAAMSASAARFAAAMGTATGWHDQPEG
jgi:hypothetical protein